MSNNLAFIVWFTNLSIKLCQLQNLMLKNIKYLKSIYEYYHMQI